MEVHRLFNEEVVRHNGANLRVVVKATDLTETTANTAQTLNLFTTPAKAAVRLVKAVLKTAFKDASDAAFNTTAITVGDGSDVDRFLASTELNENGTEVLLKVGPAATGTGGLAVAVTTDLTGVDTGTDMTAAQAAAIEADLAALAAAVNGVTGGTPWHVYTAEDTVDLVVNAMADKALNDVDTGELHLYFAFDEN